MKSLETEIASLKQEGANAGSQNQSLLDQLNHANEVIRQKDAEIEQLTLTLNQTKAEAERREQELEK